MMDTSSQTQEQQQTGYIDPVFVTIISPQGAAYGVSCASPSVFPIVRPLAHPCISAYNGLEHSMQHFVSPKWKSAGS